MNKPCPCRYCVAPKRHPGCHAECPEYKEWDAEHQQHLEEVRKKKQEESVGCLPYNTQCRIIKIMKRRRK